MKFSKKNANMPGWRTMRLTDRSVPCGPKFEGGENCDLGNLLFFCRHVSTFITLITNFYIFEHFQKSDRGKGVGSFGTLNSLFAVTASPQRPNRFSPQSALFLSLTEIPSNPCRKFGASSKLPRSSMPSPLGSVS